MIKNNTNRDIEEKIDLYVNGQLNTEQVDELWSELIRDEYYLDYFKTVANLKAVIESKRNENSSSNKLSLRKIASYASAAAVVILVGVLGVVNYSTTTNSMIRPVEEIGLDVVRSADGVSNEITEDVIKKAIQLASNGNTQEAIALLELELSNTEDAQYIADMSLSLGSILYNNGDYQQAALSFEKAIDQSEIKEAALEKGYWFLGNTYFQLNRLEEAQVAFESAYQLDGSYSRVAKSYIDVLKVSK